MATRNISLTDQFDTFIDERVKSGAYQNASEVMRAGLRALGREEAEHAAKIARLQAAIQVGLDEFERGEYEVVDDIEAWVNDLGRRPSD